MGNWTKAHKNLGLLEEKTWTPSNLHSFLWDLFTQKPWEALRDPNTGIPVKHVVGWSIWQRWIRCFSKIKRFYLGPKYWTVCLTNHTQLSDGLWCQSQQGLRIKVGLQIPRIGMPKCVLFPPTEETHPTVWPHYTQQGPAGLSSCTPKGAAWGLGRILGPGPLMWMWSTKVRCRTGSRAKGNASC